jgi:hypothetical protein
MITSFADWIRLPEVGCPKIEGPTKQGSVYTIYKVGFLGVSTTDIPIDFPSIVVQAEKYILPTIELDFGQERQLCRLPLQLTDWAFDLVALTQQLGGNPLPARIEFGVLDGRHYAEML